MKEVTVEMMRQALIACKPWNCSKEEISGRLAGMSDEQLKETDVIHELKFTSLDLAELTMHLEKESDHYSPHENEIIEASHISVAKIMDFYND